VTTKKTEGSPIGDELADELEGNPSPGAPHDQSDAVKVSKADKKAAALAAEQSTNDIDLSEGRDVPRETQFPALAGEPDVEVAERTIDYGSPTFGGDPAGTTRHVKDFVTPKGAYEDEADAVNVRNINAVRQAMVNQGLRPDGDVDFEGATDHPDGVSVILRYGVKAVPAVIASTYDTQHTVIGQTGMTPTESAEFEAGRADRIKAARDLMRAGTVEAGPVVS